MCACGLLALEPVHRRVDYISDGIAFNASLVEYHLSVLLDHESLCSLEGI